MRPKSHTSILGLIPYTLDVLVHGPHSYSAFRRTLRLQICSLSKQNGLIQMYKSVLLAICTCINNITTTGKYSKMVQQVQRITYHLDYSVQRCIPSIQDYIPSDLKLGHAGHVLPEVLEWEYVRSQKGPVSLLHLM